MGFMTVIELIAPLSDIQTFYINSSQSTQACTIDDPFAKARGLSSHTYTKTIQ